MFQRVDTLFHHPNQTLNSEQKRLISEVHRKFIHAGVQLEENKRNRLSALDQEIASLSSEYRDNLLAENNSNVVVITDKEQLHGIPSSLIDAAADKCKKRGLTDTLVLQPK